MAISKLIKPPKSINESQADTLRAYAKAFVDGLDPAQRVRFKRMIQTGAEMGKAVSEAYNVPHKQFIAEVKKII